jgi:hypothetical protein
MTDAGDLAERLAETLQQRATNDRMPSVYVNQTSGAEALPLLANHKSITNYPQLWNQRT